MDNILDGIKEEVWVDMFDDPDYYGWTPNITSYEAKQRFIEFLLKYGEKYDPNNLKYIKDYLLPNLGLVSPDVRLAQVYSYIGAYSYSDNPYIAYLNKLKEYFNIDCNILDVASGDYPAFGIEVSKELKCGKIHLYDPNLILDKPLNNNMVLCKDKFTKTTSIESFDLITSILPCSVTDLLIERILKEDKNFFIALCSCLACGTHGEHIRKHNLIIEEVQQEINRRGNGELIVDRLNPKYKNSLPILIYKKNK